MTRNKSTTSQLTSKNVSLIKDAKARLWHFTASHNSLVFELHSPTWKSRKYLLFYGVVNINTTIVWDALTPNIVGLTNDLYEISNGKDIRITFEECWLKDEYDSSKPE